MKGLFQCLLANFVRLRQVLILALDFSSGPLTNFDHDLEMGPLDAQRLVVVHIALLDLQPGGT